MEGSCRDLLGVVLGVLVLLWMFGSVDWYWSFSRGGIATVVFLCVGDLLDPRSVSGA